MAAILKALSKIKMVNLDSLVWSDDEYEISEFLEEFHLPQIVQVQEGVYESTNEKTMPAGQILKLHTFQHTEKAIGETSKGDEIRIPLSCPQKLVVLPDNCDGTECESVEELYQLSPKYARAIDTLQRPHIAGGAIFELKAKTLLSSKWYLELKNMAKPHNRVQIPFSMSARFQPLEDYKTFFLVEAINQFSFPFRVKFIDTMGKQTNSSDECLAQEHRVDLPSQGPITLYNRREETIVIATTRYGRNVTVVSFPTDLSIKFSPALGLLRGDSNYARICKEFHDGVDLEKIKKIDKLDAFFSRDTVQQVDLADYEEIPPVVPPRDDSPNPKVDNSSNGDESDEFSDSSEDEEPNATPHKGETEDLQDTREESQGQSLPPRPPKSPKVLSCSSLNNNYNNNNSNNLSPESIDPASAETHFKPATKIKNAFFNFKPKLKPKPPTKNVTKTHATQPESSLSPTSGKNRSPKYTRPSPPAHASASQSQANRFEEDSGLGWESAPIVPERTSSLRPSEEEDLNSVVSYEGGGAERMDEVFQSNDDDYPDLSLAFSASSITDASDEDHEYNYIDADKYPMDCHPRTKQTMSQSLPSRSLLRGMFNRYVGKPHSKSVTTLDDLRCVVEEDLLESLTINQVGNCLKLLHLSEYKKIFKKKQIDGSLFVTLTEQHLIDLGVMNVTDRTKLLKFINEGWVPRKR